MLGWGVDRATELVGSQFRQIMETEESGDGHALSGAQRVVL